LTDSATLSGGYNPAGTITFTLMAPDGSTVDTETAAVSGNGMYSTPTGYSPSIAGAYHWVTRYSGDVNNKLVSSGSERELANPAKFVIIGLPDFTTAGVVQAFTVTAENADGSPAVHYTGMVESPAATPTLPCRESTPSKHPTTAHASSTRPLKLPAPRRSP
jgi:hypothetical protein